MLDVLTSTAEKTCTLKPNTCLGTLLFTEYVRLNLLGLLSCVHLGFDRPLFYLRPHCYGTREDGGDNNERDVLVICSLIFLMPSCQ